MRDISYEVNPVLRGYEWPALGIRGQCARTPRMEVDRDLGWGVSTAITPSVHWTVKQEVELRLAR